MTTVFRGAEAISGSEVNFLSGDESVYPQLTRLCLDFDFKVIAVEPPRSDESTVYLVSYRGYHDHHGTAVTPAFDSLPALEEYTNSNIIDILHATLFATD